MTIAQTASEAFARYKAAYDADLLIQSQWHDEVDGRQLVCALGALGDGVNSTKDCPTQIMPRWLAQMVPWFFDNQNPEDAKSWGLKFYTELQRLNGVVPFSAIHDWHATAVGPLAVEVATKRDRDVAAHRALMAMHAETLGGKKFTAEEWKPVLDAALYDTYANTDAYAYADTYTYAYTYANADAYAYAHAYGYAHANVYAYAHADAHVNVNVNVNVKQKSIKRLADGMIECLARCKTV
jgi:hypothetical protein